MIAHFGASRGENVPDDEFVFRLTKALTVGESPHHSEVLHVLDKLKAVERFLDKNAAASLRAEFVSYFEGDWKKPPLIRKGSLCHPFFFTLSLNGNAARPCTQRVLSRNVSRTEMHVQSPDPNFC